MWFASIGNGFTRRFGFRCCCELWVPSSATSGALTAAAEGRGAAAGRARAPAALRRGQVRAGGAAGRARRAFEGGDGGRGGRGGGAGEGARPGAPRRARAKRERAGRAARSGDRVFFFFWRASFLFGGSARARSSIPRAPRPPLARAWRSWDRRGDEHARRRARLHPVLSSSLPVALARARPRGSRQRAWRARALCSGVFPLVSPVFFFGLASALRSATGARELPPASLHQLSGPLRSCRPVSVATAHIRRFCPARGDSRCGVAHPC